MKDLVNKINNYDELSEKEIAFLIDNHCIAMQEKEDCTLYIVEYDGLIKGFTTDKKGNTHAQTAKRVTQIPKQILVWEQY